jgi:hypothetical protein
MAISTRYIRVHQDALIEWTQDDSFFYEDEYSIIKDTLNDFTTFCFSKNAVDAGNYNKLPNQLYLIDNIINKFGISDPDTKPFLQETKYANNAPSRFDKVKIWFPIHWTFPNLAGLYLKIWSLNFENSRPYGLSTFYLDASISSELNKLVNESNPLRLYDRLWGKSITIYVPSVTTESTNRINNSPALGTINYNLTNGQLGLSTTSPIFIDFRYLRAKEQVLGQTSFFTLPSLVTSIPQTPEYNNLSVQIQEATDGDYFKINGIYNSNLGEFNQFMTMLESIGKRSYLIYSVTAFEDGLPQDTQDFYVYKDFFKQIIYKPVFMFTNTSAAIQVELKLINSVDVTIINKLTDLTLTGSLVSKYGKIATSINVSNAIKPKLYNSKPDNLVLPGASAINYSLSKKVVNTNEIRYVPYPVLTNIANIVADQLNNLSKGETFLGFGGLELSLTPFDNVIKLRIAEKSGDTIKPMTFPSSGSAIQLVFKSNTYELRVSLYMESNQVDLINGVIVFKLLSSQYATLKKIHETNKNFYITITTNSTETSIYDGKFTLLEETPRIFTNNTANTQTSIKSVRNVLNGSTKNNEEFLIAGGSIKTIQAANTQIKIIKAGLTPSQLKLIK